MYISFFKGKIIKQCKFDEIKNEHNFDNAFKLTKKAA